MNEASSTADFPWSQSWPEIIDPQLRRAFTRLARQPFVPEPLRPWADRDTPLPIGEGQTISQPFIVAWMTQALALQPRDKTLEIGTGSGYQTALLCEMTTGESEVLGQHVYSVERHASLSQQAAQVLNSLGYHPHLRVGDGAVGWPEAAPFAAIIVTAAPAHLPRPLWEQLAEGGRIAIPIGPTPDDQTLWLIRKEQGVLRATNLGEVRFVPLVSPVLNQPEMWIEIR